ncbi:hypothetical protein OH76DRAFT_469922 [Lentinus brumalis]|uniref:Uncharacterized protein n=1 Tax=Lentinus brumalis TaxID=2498619 RepID=A0A371DCQ3_9APHY|nr:hypothetical protein OH76DRAFT_469922 [Polyporus brumalis]
MPPASRVGPRLPFWGGRGPRRGGATCRRCPGCAARQAQAGHAADRMPWSPSSASDRSSPLFPAPAYPPGLLALSDPSPNPLPPDASCAHTSTLRIFAMVQMHRHLSDDPAPRSSNNCVPSEVRTPPRSLSRLLPWTFSTYPDCCCTPNILYVTRVEALPRKSHFLPPRDAQRRTPAPQRSRGVDVGMVTTRNVSLCAHNVQGPAAGPYSVRASKFALGECSSGCGSSCIMRESRPCTIAVGVRRCARRRTGDPGMQGSGVESVSLSMQVSLMMHDDAFS